MSGLNCIHGFRSAEEQVYESDQEQNSDLEGLDALQEEMELMVIVLFIFTKIE